MKSIPLPLRLAAGLAVSAAERAKDLPRQITGLPITVASQLLQFSMRVQQQVTELAIKGDEALSGFYPVEETPSWATFDEDGPFDDSGFAAGPLGGSAFDQVAEPDFPDDYLLPEQRYSSNGHDIGVPVAGWRSEVTPPEDPWEAEVQAQAEELPPEPGPAEVEPAPEAASQGTSALPWLPNYDQLSLPQVRARLRGFTEDQLAELLEYERGHAGRASFIGMLARRIENVRKLHAEQSKPDQTP